MSFSIKQKRAFQTVLSGLKFSRYGNRPVRFLTLTTSLVMVQSLDSVPGVQNSHFQILRKRILRHSPYRLFSEGYITKDEMKRFYGHSDLFKKFSFEYFKVETNERNGVLHILYRGSYLPHSWISSVWSEIHNSPIVNIKLLDFQDEKKTSCYIVSQYVSSQNSSYVRSSQSWNWVFRGFKSMWYLLKRDYPKECFSLWDNILQQHAKKYFYNQSSWSVVGPPERSNIVDSTILTDVRDHSFERWNLPNYYRNYYLDEDMYFFFTKLLNDGLL